MIAHFMVLYCGNSKTLKWLFRVIHNGSLAVEFDSLVLPPRRRVCLTEDLYLKCKLLWRVAARRISRSMSAKTGPLAAGKNTYVISGVTGCRFVSSGLNHVIWHGLLQQRVAYEQDGVTSHWLGYQSSPSIWITVTRQVHGIHSSVDVLPFCGGSMSTYNFKEN